MAVPGIRRSVLIRRDRYGIPYIEAESDDDAWYALGFCQGQDRALQIEGMLRVMRGTLAELVGPKALPVDRLSRRIGFQQAAERQLQFLDEETLRMLEAFAHGVTDGSRIGCRRRAHEFTLLRARPTPYRAADVLALAKLHSFLLASNWDAELARLKILTEDGPEALKALEPAYPEWLPVSAPPGVSAGPAIDRLSEDLAVFQAATGRSGGSNNWVLSPSRTATGRPLLANDPHLGPSLPPHWYLAHVRTPAWAVAGATLVGSPSFLAGHNDVAAWGNTAGLLDNTDLFLEQIGPDGRSVRHGDGFLPCETRLEVIQVRGRPPVKEEVLITPRGPIIGPALKDEVKAISLRATWLDPRPMKGLLHVHLAHTFEEFRRIFDPWPGPPLNMVYADTSGTIGWQLVGDVPRRRKGWGTIPLPGWDTEIGWEDEPIPFARMPHLSDPPTGFVATANNCPVPPDQEPFLGTDWVDGYRVARIVEALAARDDWDLAAMQNLQMDRTSIPWRELRPIIAAAPVETDEARHALTLLKAWDGVVAPDSPAAALFEFFLSEMIRRVVEARAPRAASWALGKGVTPLAPSSFFVFRRVSHLVRLLREQPEGWFDRSWLEGVADALTAAVRALRDNCGADPRRWAWGRVRPLTLRHPMGERWPLHRVFNLGPFPWGGDTNTVNQATADLLNPTANPFGIASLRMVVDVGNWEENRFAVPGGQSGNPLSPHYDDLLALWQRGEGVPIAWSPEEVERAAEVTLRLVPGENHVATPKPTGNPRKPKCE